MASSNEDARLLELFQLQNEEGPCLESVRTGDVVNVPDLNETLERWPRFSPAALDRGFRSVHAVPLRLREDRIGGLNLFSDTQSPLSDEDHRVVQALADVATIAILQQRSLSVAGLLAEQLQNALNSRIIIEQAKGVLAESGNLEMGEAFEALRAHARSTNQRLSDVAQRIVTRETGRLRGAREVQPPGLTPRRHVDVREDASGIGEGRASARPPRPLPRQPGWPLPGHPRQTTPRPICPLRPPG